MRFRRAIRPESQTRSVVKARASFNTRKAAGTALIEAFFDRQRVTRRGFLAAIIPPVQLAQHVVRLIRVEFAPPKIGNIHTTQQERIAPSRNLLPECNPWPMFAHPLQNVFPSGNIRRRRVVLDAILLRQCAVCSLVYFPSPSKSIVISEHQSKASREVYVIRRKSDEQRPRF